MPYAEAWSLDEELQSRHASQQMSRRANENTVYFFVTVATHTICLYKVFFFIYCQSIRFSPQILFISRTSLVFKSTGEQLILRLIKRIFKEIVRLRHDYQSVFNGSTLVLQILKSKSYQFDN